MKYEVLPGYHVATKERKEPFFPGEKLNLDEKEGKRLSDLGIVKAVTGETQSADPGGAAPLNATETIKLVMEASTLDDVLKLKDGEGRKGVLDAIAKREKQFETSDLETLAGMASLEDIEAVFAGETRPAVLDVLQKRRTELTT